MQKNKQSNQKLLKDIEARQKEMLKRFYQGGFKAMLKGKPK